MPRSFLSIMTTTTFPRALNYGIYLAVFVMNAIVLVTMGYSMGIQKEIFTDGEGFVGPMIAAIITGIGITICLIPAYIVGIIMVGVLVYWEYLGSRVGGCSFRSADDKTWIVDDRRCQMVWHTFGGSGNFGYDPDVLFHGIDSDRLRPSDTCTKTSGSERSGLSVERRDHGLCVSSMDLWME
ncbi:hypothetical protein C8J56DRAFT_111537 [Mycena floridula]|nr:hypothetical protein C8J56DRAFT_111537 [Mycena floridula]